MTKETINLPCNRSDLIEKLSSQKYRFNFIKISSTRYTLTTWEGGAGRQMYPNLNLLITELKESNTTVYVKLDESNSIAPVAIAAIMCLFSLPILFKFSDSYYIIPFIGVLLQFSGIYLIHMYYKYENLKFFNSFISDLLKFKININRNQN